MVLSSWIQTVLLYLWLAAAIYLFHIWTRMCQSLFKALEIIGKANMRLVNASDQFSQQVSDLLETSKDLVEKVATQFTQELNPLLDEQDVERQGEKYKTE